MIKMENFQLEKIDYNNTEHLKYLKTLMKSKDMSYLWDITDSKLDDMSNSYIVRNAEDDMVGYLNLSNPTDSFYGSTISLYYAIEESKRGQGYGKRLVEDVKNWQLQKEKIDCIVAQVEPSNVHSQNALLGAGMKEVMRDEDFVTFIEKSEGKSK